MTKASDNVFPKVKFAMQTANQAAPSDSSWTTYAKADGIYARSSNAVVGPFGAASGGSFTFTGARAYNSADKSLNNGSFTDLTMDSEDYDTSTFHDTSSNTNRLVAPATGKYRVAWGGRFSAGGATETIVLIQKNTNTGVTNALAGMEVPGNVTVSAWFTVTWEGNLTSGDYVKAEAFVDASSKSMKANYWMTIQRIDP